MIIRQLVRRAAPILPGAFAWLIVVSCLQRAEAASVSYTVDPANSSLQISGTIATQFNLAPQAIGSDVTGLQGTIQADLTGNVLTFAGGSAVDALAISGTFTPASAQTGSGASENNFAVEDDLTGTFFQAVIRDALVDLISGSATFGGAVTALTFQFDGGTVDYHDGFFDDYNFLDMTTFDAVTNQSAGLLTRVINGNIETITIPISGTVTFSAVIADDSELTLNGQVVAARLIPEPATHVLVLLGVLFAGILRRRAK